MAGVTEIYICQPGQRLKEGELVISHDVTTREQAQTDAAMRRRIDRNIARIVYYAIRPDGGFRTIYSYENPDARSTRPERPLVADLKIATSYRFRRPPKAGLFDRLRGLFESD